MKFGRLQSLLPFPNSLSVDRTCASQARSSHEILLGPSPICIRLHRTLRCRKNVSQLHFGQRRFENPRPLLNALNSDGIETLTIFLAWSRRRRFVSTACDFVMANLAYRLDRRRDTPSQPSCPRLRILVFGQRELMRGRHCQERFERDATR